LVLRPRGPVERRRGQAGHRVVFHKLLNLFNAGFNRY
jgi:hypothetical protein